MSFLEISKKIRVKTLEFNEKKLRKNSVVAENQYLKKTIEKEISDHQNTIENLEKTLFYGDFHGNSLENQRSSDLFRKKHDLLKKIEELQREKTVFSEKLKDFKGFNEELERKITVFMKEYNDLHKEIIVLREGIEKNGDFTDFSEVFARENIEKIEEKLSKINEFLDYNRKKQVFLENKIKMGRKPEFSTNFSNNSSFFAENRKTEENWIGRKGLNIEKFRDFLKKLEKNF